MTLKTYQAPSMADAIAEVKRDLGREAVILQTRSFRKGAFLGILGGKSTWEVTAAPNLNVLPRGPRGEYLNPARDNEVVAREEGCYVSESPEPQTSDETQRLDENADRNASEPPRESNVSVPMENQLQQIRRMLDTVLASRDGSAAKLPASLQEFHEHLCSQDVSESIASDLVMQVKMDLTGQELADRDAVQKRLRELVAQRIACCGPNGDGKGALRGRVVALVGPTGVGKTTTIAKLAANMKLQQNKRVGLITIDTYRIAAVDQLKTYADIIDVPLKPVLSPEEMKHALHEMRDMDTVLIDTVGRSQNDRLKLNQLRSFLSVADPDEMHLVIAATSNRRTAENVVQRFAPLGVNRLILTKLDETESHGLAITVATEGDRPLSYVSTGQEVPDDISIADPQVLAERILGGGHGA